MGNIFKMAWRNILAHKTKSLIIGFLVFASSFLFVLANSFLSSAETGMANTYRNSLTGELAAFKAITYDYSLFGTWGDMGNIVMPNIPDFDYVYTTISEHPGVEKSLSLSTSFALLLNDGEESAEWIVPFGVTPSEYARMFDVNDTITIHEGRYLQDGEEGVLLPLYVVEKYAKNEGITLGVGDEIMIMAWGSGNPKIRRVPIQGIFTFNHVKLGDILEDNMPMLPRTAIMEIGSFKSAFEKPASSRIVLAETESDMFLDSGDMASLFSNTVEESTADFSFDEDLDLDSLFGTATATDASKDFALLEDSEEVLSGAAEGKWILMRTKDQSPAGIQAVQRDLMKTFENEFASFEDQDFPNPQGLTSILANQSNKISPIIWPHLTQGQQDVILESAFADPGTQANNLTEVFNHLIQEETDWVEEVHIHEHYLSRVTRDLIKGGLNGGQTSRLARLILEETFPGYIQPGPDIQINEWWQAGAPMSFVTLGITTVFNGGMIIVFLIIAIVLANTMMISVMERTSEIGTIRAIGGRKSFLAGLFISESVLTTNIFTFLGALVAMGLIVAFGTQGIYIPDDSFLVMMLGSNTYTPMIDVGSVILIFILMNLVGLVAALVPTFFATRVSPLKAMQDE